MATALSPATRASTLRALAAEELDLLVVGGGITGAGIARDAALRGLRVGLVSVCSEEVERAWPETPFHGRFDAEVFSCTAGLSKPDPRAYTSCCDALGVEPGESLFVGDGANDELAGAERAGLRAVLIHRPGEDPPWPGLGAWAGPRVTSVPEILELV